MAWVPIAMAVVSAVGAVAQAQSAKSAANYNAQIADRNALVTRQQAESNEAAQRRNTYRAMGRIRAGYAGAGVTPEGSPLEVLEDSAAEAELDALNIRYRGEIGATGYEDEGKLQRSRASSAMATGALNAGSALLSGAGSYYKSYGSSPAPSQYTLSGSAGFYN